MSAELDVGPLSWVKDEIDLALERAAQSLASAGTLPEARASLHQAGGALAIVGLAGVDEFSAAIEGLLAAAADGGIGWGERQAEVARAAIAALRGYLDELMAGAPNQPLRLLPAYRSLAEARGGPPPAPSELFFPDLTQRPPHRESDSPALSPEALAARLKAATDKPVLMGFGVSTPEHAVQIAASADGVIVGTALVRRLLDGGGAEEAHRFISSLRKALDET